MCVCVRVQESPPTDLVLELLYLASSLALIRVSRALSFSLWYINRLVLIYTSWDSALIIIRYLFRSIRRLAVINGVTLANMLIRTQCRFFSFSLRGGGWCVYILIYAYARKRGRVYIRYISFIICMLNCARCVRYSNLLSTSLFAYSDLAYSCLGDKVRVRLRFSLSEEEEKRSNRCELLTAW